MHDKPKTFFSQEYLQHEGELDRLLQLIQELKDSKSWFDGCSRVILYCTRYNLGRYANTSSFLIGFNGVDTDIISFLVPLSVLRLIYSSCWWLRRWHNFLSCSIISSAIDLLKSLMKADESSTYIIIDQVDFCLQFSHGWDSIFIFGIILFLDWNFFKEDIKVKT